ncbi:DUF1932 domain-containing protein [Klebsiella pneumoniae]|uniref:DUF1932 domain-containing protein n=1 Tax=Klebsiella pneumoniae TaxID=573 RepID=UPI001D198452|nr:DUF1932 domain-containing protein [Klebsiella pneumoniae]
MNLLNKKGLVIRHLPRHDEAVLRRCEAAGVATLHEAWDRQGLMGPAIRPIQQGVSRAGNAVTVLVTPGDNWMFHVAVMAPVPPARLQTPLLIGGPQAEAIAPRLQGLGLNARYGASTVGQVSAIKMCRSVMIKGLEALTTECLFAAREYGVEEEVLSSLHHSFPSLGWTGAFPDYLISRVAEHGIRRSEEMEEVVKTLRDVGSAGIMSEAIAKSQRQLPEQMAARSLSYRQLTPFDWKTLVARLK